jgi:gliding motility-associated-like protein
MKNEGLPINSNCVTCETLIPNVFTPNNDLSNDYFSFLIKEQEGFLGFQILNRWGEIVYITNDLSISWDGKSGGKECTDGIYFWNLNYDSKNSSKSKSGFLTLIR